MTADDPSGTGWRKAGAADADVPAPPPPPDDDAHLVRPAPPRTGPVLMVVAQAVAVVVLMAIFGAARDPPPILNVLFIVLILRLVGDLAVLGKPRSPVAVGIEGHAKALSWGIGGLGLMTILAFGGLEGGAPWIVGVAIALGGLNLYGHHRRAEPVSRRLMIEEGTVGAFLAAIGLPLALNGALDGPAALILPGILLALGLVVAVTTMRRLLHRKAPAAGVRDEIGWNAWFQENFFRHMLILAAVVAYLFLRRPVRDLVGPLFVPVEYGIGVLLLGSVFLSLRSYLKKRLAEHPLQSPHRRHEETIVRQSDPGYDHLDQAMGAFLDHGDAEPIKALGDNLDQRGVPASRHLTPITGHKAPDHITLVHPAWLYGARVAVIFLVALALGLFLGDLGAESGDADAERTLTTAGWSFFALILGIGLYLSQWNRFGGPWWGRTATGYVGLLFLFLADIGLGSLTGTGRSLLTSIRPGFVGVLLWLALLASPIVHLLRRDKAPRPHYAVTRRDPVATIEHLRVGTEGIIFKRLLWLGIIAVAVFITIGQITRFTDAPLASLFNIYLVVAAAFLVHPMLLVAGLRLGKDHVARQDQLERARRKGRYDAAMVDLGRLFADLRYPPRLDERPEALPGLRLGPDGRPTPYGMPGTAPPDATVGLPGFRPSEAVPPPPHDHP